MAKTIDDKDLKIVTGGTAIDLTQSPTTVSNTVLRTKSEGGSTPGGPSSGPDNAAGTAPTSGPVDLARR